MRIYQGDDAEQRQRLDVVRRLLCASVLKTSPLGEHGAMIKYGACEICPSYFARISHLRKKMSSLHIQQLTKCYPGASTPALNHVSLHIADGELFFLLGPSGCGKTTLLRLIGGFESPTEGVISSNSENITALPANERNTAMVFQGYALFPHLTVAENIAFGLEMQKCPKDEIAQRVTAVMEEMQITQYAQRTPNQLSGGQQQRVALARTLVVHPSCLLLDEPLANLDAKLRRDMRLEIRRICHEYHLTAVYVTHDRSEALSMADRVAVMKDGVIVQVGTPLEIYRRPVNSFVANFLGETNLLKGIMLSQDDNTRRCRVKTAAGILECAAPAKEIAENSTLTLAIRPETLHVVTNTAGTNIFQVTLEQQEYLGETMEHLGRLTDGSPLKFYEINPRDMHQPGGKVSIAVDAQDIVCLPE